MTGKQSKIDWKLFPAELKQKLWSCLPFPLSPAHSLGSPLVAPLERPQGLSSGSTQPPILSSAAESCPPRQRQTSGWGEQSLPLGSSNEPRRTSSRRQGEYNVYLVSNLDGSFKNQKSFTSTKKWPILG